MHVIFFLQDVSKRLGPHDTVTSGASVNEDMPIPSTTSQTAEQMLRNDADRLLKTWLQNSSVAAYLQSLPEFIPCASMAGCIQKFRGAVHTLMKDQVGSSAAMQTAPLLAETTCYPFAVMLMAASLASATPVAFLSDNICSVMHSRSGVGAGVANTTSRCAEGY